MAANQNKKYGNNQYVPCIFKCSRKFVPLVAGYPVQTPPNQKYAYPQKENVG